MPRGEDGDPRLDSDAKFLRIWRGDEAVAVFGDVKRFLVEDDGVDGAAAPDMFRFSLSMIDLHSRLAGTAKQILGQLSIFIFTRFCAVFSVFIYFDFFKNSQLSTA